MKYPERIQRALQRAEAHINRGVPAEALADLETAVEKCPKGFLPWSLLGRAKSMLGDQSAAEAAYRKALQISPGDAATWFNLGVTFSAREMFAEAVPCYEKSLKYQRTAYDAEAAQNLASCYLKQGRFDEARDIYLELLQFGDDANLRSLLGMAYAGMGDHQSAVQAFERSMDLGMSLNLLLCTNLSACYKALGDEERAAEYQQHVDAFKAADATQPGL